MSDAFAIFGLPRLAALDEETLRRAYAEKSRAAHPDCGGSDQEAARINAAHETLRAPDRRLKHLLEIAAPPEAAQWRAVPVDDEMMRSFSKLGAAINASGRFLEKKSRARSALAKALLANEEMAHRESLERIGADLARRQAEMEALLPALDEALESRDRSAWERLGSTQAQFAYLLKWRRQIRERLLELM